ncbi:MAG: class I SAM-dependent methyltransferase [Thermoplasmata archaeon]|nr:class I SAM-dependent methyltransferase [Thermoplasmata archaeon]
MEFFDSAYEGIPPWDIGRPQPAFVRLEESGRIEGSVLDIGCGTGENALYLAARGHETWGVDASPRAIAKAQTKAARRDIAVEFRVEDALALHRLGRTFETVIDSGLFHVFSDAERVPFLRSLGSVLRSGGSYFMLAFCDQEPSDWGGPRRLTQEEIRATFQEGWTVEAIRPAKFESNIHEDGGLAWLSEVNRL